MTPRPDSRAVSAHSASSSCSCSLAAICPPMPPWSEILTCSHVCAVCVCESCCVGGVS